MEENATVANIASLPKHFDSKEAEARWSAQWLQTGIYASLGLPRAEQRFVVDTPPPTVSGSLHIGHVFSFTHTDLLARFHRMCGRDVVYPMGWDDNGLPTERRVQNYFNVRCDPRQPYDPSLKTMDQPGGGSDAPARQISRENFIELCLRLTAEDERAFKALWNRVGLSVDWNLEYSTVDDRSRSVAQLSFLDLHRKGHIYSVEAPTMWDVDFQTAVAQAELEERVTAGHMHQVRFGIDNSSDIFTIATTRPELLPACVGVAAHPDDARYRHLFGRRAITPLFRVPVTIFSSDLVDPEKGTGILMVCTFGDATDVRWWKENNLPLRQVLGRDGRLISVNFQDSDWKSLNSDAANRFYSELIGKNVKQARRTIVELLRDPAGSATDSAAPLVGEPQPLQHAVKFYEKGDRPLEFITTRQWFVRLLDKKAALLEYGDQIRWHPDFMRLRYRTWTENLAFDWAISRQRYFGVPFPLWYPLRADGSPDFENPILASDDQLPVDPTIATPPGYEESQRNRPGGFSPENDVFDTWFTSSMSPQIVAGWPSETARFQSMFPMDVRPQSHEIIRTWAFYTIAKSMLHHQSIPWRNVAISGWILDPDRKKMSKSKGNVITPMALLDEHGSDAVRYWASSAQLGADTAFDVNVMKVGKRLVTKIFNAGKFVFGQTGNPGPVTYGIDLLFLGRLKQLVERVTKAMEDYNHEVALAETERFFWVSFTDAFIEMARTRARGSQGEAEQGSAITALRLAFSVLLRLFAPFLPFITEEVWSWSAAQETGHSSIHRAPWPSAADFKDVSIPTDLRSFEVAILALAAINKKRAEHTVSTAREIESVTLAVPSTMEPALTSVLEDIRMAARGRAIDVTVAPHMADGVIEVGAIAFCQ